MRKGGRTDRHDESITCFSKKFESAWKIHTHIKQRASMYPNGPFSDLPQGYFAFRVTVCNKWNCARSEDILWNRSKHVVCCTQLHKLYLCPRILIYLTFWGTCIVIYSYKRSWQDALVPNFIFIYSSTCFGQT